MRILVISKKRLVALSILVMGTIGLLFSGLFKTSPSLVRTPGTFYMVNTQDKVIALTFDDGPDPAFTEPILDVLKQQDIKATFFVLGEAAQTNPYLLRRMIKEGHEIGNHGYTHDYRQRHLAEELTKTDAVVFSATHIHTHLYRPPGGRVTKNQLETVRTEGHQVVLWSVDSKDWQNPGAKRIVRNVTNNCFPGGIVLLHDGGDKREQTVEALEQIISQLKEQGYRFVTLSQLKSMDSALK